MKDPTNAKRQREWYARRKQGISWQPLTCNTCGNNHSGKHGGICCRCWEKTPEGKEAKAKAARARRSKKK